jgi:predicted MFS family arabinose efflux permease
MKQNSSKWTQVILLFVIYTSSTISTNCLPAFFPEIIKEFGWTIGQVSEPTSYYFIIIAIFAPIVGYLLTKLPAKSLMLFGISLAFISQILLSKITSYTQFYSIYVALSIAITFSGLIPSMVIIANWFDEKRGVAVGVLLLGSSFGGIIYPQFAKYLMPEYGWRNALLGVACLGAFLSYLPMIFVKNKPSVNLNFAKSNFEGKIGLTLNQAFKTNTFYVLLIITASFWFCGFGVLSHLRLYLNEHHFSLEKATNISSTFFIFSIIGKLFFGYISDNFNKQNILILATIFLILGILCLKMIDQNVYMAYGYAVAYGFGYSGAFAMIQLTVADVYRGKSFGSILGFVNSFDSIGGFLGVLLLGKFHDSEGTYDFGVNVLFSVCCVALICSVLLKILDLKASKKLS